MALSSQPLISRYFPYLPLTLTVQGGQINIEAILDTGFDGSVIVPQYTFPPTLKPNYDLAWTLADGTTIKGPAFAGTVHVGHFGPFDVVITSVGNESLIGRALTNLFTITLDHGQQVIVTL